MSSGLLLLIQGLWEAPVVRDPDIFQRLYRDHLGMQQVYKDYVWVI